MYAYILGVKLPAPFILETDSCKRFSSPCPLAANTDYTYTTTVFVQPKYPKVYGFVCTQLLQFPTSRN